MSDWVNQGREYFRSWRTPNRGRGTNTPPPQRPSFLSGPGGLTGTSRPSHPAFAPGFGTPQVGTRGLRGVDILGDSGGQREGEGGGFGAPNMGNGGGGPWGGRGTGGTNPGTSGGGGDGGVAREDLSPSDMRRGVLGATRRHHGDFTSKETLAVLSMQTEDNKDGVMDAVTHAHQPVLLLFMNNSSPYVHSVVAPTRYYVHGGIQEIQGRVIGFIGNRGRPVLLPKKATWEFKDVKILDGTAAVAEAQQNPDDLSDSRGTNDVTVPRVLLGPISLAPKVVGKKITPMQLYQVFCDISTDQDVTDADVSDEGPWAQSKNWCLAAFSKNSGIAIKLEGADMFEEEFDEWVETVLANKLGMEFSQPTESAIGYLPQGGWNGPIPPYNGASPYPQPSGTPAAFSGHHVTHQQQQPSTSTTSSNGTFTYTDNQIAKLMGLSGTAEVAKLGVAYRLVFPNTHKKTELDHARQSLETEAKAWCVTNNLHYDNDFYVEDDNIEDIAEVNPTPGGHLASHSTAAAGLTPFQFLPVSAEDMQELKRQADNKRKTMDNMTYNVLMTITKKHARPPNNTFRELRNTMTAFLAYTAVLHSDSCPFVKELLKIVDAMHHLQRVVASGNSFTPYFCRKFLWWVYVESREFFSSTLSPSDFAGPDSPPFPQPRTLDVLKTALLTGKIDELPHFPDKWKEPDLPTPSASTSGVSEEQMRRYVASQLGTQQRSSGGGNAMENCPEEIRSLFQQLEADFGRVTHATVMKAGQVPYDSLPDEVSQACITNFFVRGGCRIKGCIRTHVKKEQLSAGTVDKWCKAITPGIEAIKKNGLPRAEKRRV